MPRMSLAEIAQLVERSLRQWGLSEPHVEAVSRIIVAGERDGCESHGLYRLLVCAHTIRNGKVVLDAEPAVADSAPAFVRVSGKGGFAPLAFKAGRPLLLEKARSNGIAALALNDVVHFAALWPEVETLARDGVVAFACTPSHAWVAPAGGTSPLFGTNPIAFGWPRPDTDPYVFDFATSAAARGEIELRRRRGEAIPTGWALDRRGRPTTDPAAALAGAMLTFGGHKGSALATMVELIAGPLIGDLTSRESLEFDGGVGASPMGGELILAADLDRLLGPGAGDARIRAERLFDAMTGQGARLPSQRRYANRVRAEREGVDISDQFLAELESIGAGRNGRAHPVARRK